MGTVSRIMAKASRKQPMIKYINRMINITVAGDISKPETKSASAFARPEKITKLFSVIAPIKIVKIIAEVCPVSSSVSFIISRFRRLRENAINSAPKAPTPAASVGVKTPK